jgi:Flp pilus assembly protein TadD
MRKLAVLLFCSTLSFLCAPLVASQDNLQRASELYGRTKYQESLRVLISEPGLDAAGYALAGKNYYMLGNYKKATESFEKAASLAQMNPEYALWLGRTYGRKAEAGSWLLAPMNASRARQYFEKAVALSPHYHEALNDLFAFYLQAPGFVGGGVDKAEAIAKRVAEESPAEYYYDQAQLAEKKKDYAAEESHLRRAIELAPREVGRVIDLARFFARRGRVAETDQAFAQAETVAPADPRIDFERAKIYVESRRDLEEARKLLRHYLAAEIKPDYPPKQAAETLLRKAMEN